MKKLLLLALVLAFATSCDFLKDKLRVHLGVEGATPAVEEPIEVYPIDMVYCYAYDGFVNMRDCPSYKSIVIGKFRNGPEGAILLDDQGEWMKIDVEGIVGYVPSKYISRTPTVAYTGRVGVDWLEGIWRSTYSTIRIYNNGYFEYDHERDPAVGYYIMQNNEVKFVWLMAGYPAEDGTVVSWMSNGAKGLPSEDGWVMKIDERAGTLVAEFEEDDVECDRVYYKCSYGGEFPTKTEHRCCGRAIADHARTACGIGF